MNVDAVIWPPETLLLVGGAFMLAGLVKGTLGLGLPMTVIVLLVGTIGLKSAIGLTLLPSIAMNVWQALVGGSFFLLLRRLWPMLVMAIIGVWVGVQILAASNSTLMVSVLAVVLIAYSGWSLVRAQVPPPGRWEVVLSPIAGFAGGTVFGMVGNFMVPGVIYHQALDLGRDRLVQALGMSFVAISVVMLILMSRFELIDESTLVVSAAAMVPGLIGMATGQMLRRFLDEAQFRRLFLVGLMLGGVYMLVRAQFA